MGHVKLAPGQILAVPGASRIRTLQASLADITRALQRARGPPLLAWCQANGPRHYCRRRNVDCMFKEPQEDSWRDLAAVAVVLHGGGARLGPGLGVRQGGEGECSTASGGGTQRRTYGIGDLGNPGPPEILQAEVRRLQEEVEGLQEEVQVARQERNKVAQARDTLVRNRDALFKRWEAQDRELGQLQALFAQEQAARLAGIPMFTAPSEQEVEELAQGLRQSDDSEVRRREWLLCKVVAARLEVLGWARKHCLLVDGMSLGVSYVEEELAGQEVTPGLMWGVGRLSRLMGAHQHRTFVEAGSWMEAFVDGLQTPPLAKEMIQAAQDLLESEFGPRGGQGESQEGREGGD
ncbi:hypothetical protein C0992_005412 [Termitomyces sp. T32_za158]|nr:hypothetical protein C0992_005412 [Termitomyces sp. T32_za158]